MATVNLAARPREGAGKGVARKIRQADRVPVIVYGYETDPFMCSVDAAELRKALGTRSGTNAVIRLDLEGSDWDNAAIVKEIQRHPVSRDIIHLDLLAIDLNVPVDVSVPVSPQGTPVGVKLEGGVLSWGRRDVTIRVLPTKIPEDIELDISGLHINDALHISDVPAEGFEVVDDPELTICSVSSTKLEVEPEGEEEAVEGEEEAAEAAGEGEEETPVGERED